MAKPETLRAPNHPDPQPRYRCAETSTAEVAGPPRREHVARQVNTGMREKEVCQLRWEWEQPVPELDTDDFKRTVFVLPEWVTKNKEARVVVLNDVARRIIDGVRGLHPTYVFTWIDRKGRRRRFTRLNNSGWKAARR